MVAPSVQDLFDNPPELFMIASEQLISFAEKILNNPSDPKCRSIAVGSSEIESMLPVKGAIDCLFTMGFLEDGEFFTFPLKTDVGRLRVTRNEILQEKSKFLKRQLTREMEIFVNSYSHYETESIIPGFVDRHVYPKNVKEQEKSFYIKLMQNYKTALSYEDSFLQEKAKEHIPIKTLRENAEKSFRHVKNEKKKSKYPLQFDDYLLMELVYWFKEQFFHWVNHPLCDICGGESEPSNQKLSPNAEEQSWDASRIESYVCKSCHSSVRFARYNNPLKLLETRRGRCGEWANCFTLCCRALQFEARYVVDWTDHVWTEVYSNSQQRWIHVDSCEGICDKPLLYEVGWKKNISYIMACSYEEVVDVTWRYSCKHKEVLANRSLCRENWLLEILRKLNTVCGSFQTPQRKAVLLERRALEVAEFLCPRSPNEEENKGRSSGSLEWRLQRGETTKKDVSKEPYVFSPTAAEIKAKAFHLQYSSSENIYIREFDNVHLNDWELGVYSCTNIFRKVEDDWKMAYLARKEGTDTASIVWKFDFGNSGAKINCVKLMFQSQVFEDGKIDCMLCGENSCISIPQNGQMMMLDDFRGLTTFTLKADLSKGKGISAWQHTQLFRQSLNGKKEYSFDLLVTLI